MARALRIEYEGAFYHVTSRGNDRKRIFFSKADYNKFKLYLEEGINKFGYRIHSYVLMTINKKGELRSLAVYLMKRHTEMTNNEIGEYFEGLSYSGIAKIRQRFLEKMLKDKALKKKVEKLDIKLSNAKD